METIMLCLHECYKTAQEFNELKNPATKNIVVTNGRILCQFGTLVNTWDCITPVIN